MALIDRTGAEVLIPLEYSTEIFQGVSDTSSVLRLGRRLPNMTAKQRRLPVLSLYPMAYFVNGDTGLKQTSNSAWEGKFLEAEEIAVIVPIPENVLDDADFDIWAQVKPLIISAIGKVADQAVFYGLNKPASWPQGIVPGAAAAGNTIAQGTLDSAYLDIMGQGGLISLVEEDGYLVTGHVGAMQTRGYLRGIVDGNGQPIFRPMSGLQNGTEYALDGSPIEFPRNGAIDAKQSLLISGDFSQLVYAIRQDVSFKLLDQAVITNTDNTILYNLAQQDMVALRVVMRMAWQLPNPINQLNPDGNSRYPFAVLTAAEE